MSWEAICLITFGLFCLAWAIATAAWLLTPFKNGEELE